MKKATRIIILLLAAATLLAIYLPESDAGKMINNTVNVKSAVNTVTDTVKDTVEDGVDAVADGVEGVVDGADDLVDGVVDAVKDEANEALDGVEDAIEEILEDVEEAVEGDDSDDSEEAVEEVVIANDGYVTYDAEAVAMATESGKNVALFFHADRCGSCKALSSDIESNEASIDDNTMIFKVDYDSSKELKEKYGVSKQHTVVYLNELMEATSVEQGVSSLETVLEGFAQ